MDVGDRSSPELLAGGSDPLLPAWADRWRALLPVRRQAARGAAVGLLVVLALAGLLQWRVERAVRDEVRLRVRLGVTVASTTAGGRVDYHLSVRNDGPRRVRVQSVRLDAPRLDGRARALLPADVGRRASVDVPLSVRLDCRAPAAPETGSRGVRVLVTAVPLSGRARRLALAADDGRVLTAPAGTLCRVRPGLVLDELSGPVVRQVVTDAGAGQVALPTALVTNG